jgi:hypothetical protein
MNRTAAILAAGAALLGSGPALGHHGKDFLVAHTADLPDPGEVYLAPRQAYVPEDGEAEAEVEPALLVGILDRLALDVHAHAAVERDGAARYESTAAGIQLRLTPRGAAAGVGVSAEYTRARGEEPADRIEARLAISSTRGRSAIALNALAARGARGGSGAAWGYAAGFRRGVSGRAAIGLEARGGPGEPAAEALAGLYLSPAPRVTVNLGAGRSAGGGEAAFAARAAVVLRLGRTGSGGAAELD